MEIQVEHLIRIWGFGPAYPDRYLRCFTHWETWIYVHHAPNRAANLLESADIFFNPDENPVPFHELARIWVTPLALES